MPKTVLNSLPAPPHIQRMLELFGEEISFKLNQHKFAFDRLVAVSYAISSIDGTTYYIKAYIGNNQFIHVKLCFSMPTENVNPIMANILPDRKLQEPFYAF